MVQNDYRDRADIWTIRSPIGIHFLDRLFAAFSFFLSFFISFSLFIVSTIDSSRVFRVIENIFILSAYETCSLVTCNVGTRAEK